jgi:hypothetical protein
MDICLAAARAAASRRNGAKSRGPKTPEGKERSAQNALKHGLRARKCALVDGESAQEFEALEAALLSELAPEGALQSALAARIARATWRLERAERLVAGTGLGPRSPTRRPRGRVVRALRAGRPESRCCPDPRWQWRGCVRHPAALSRHDARRTVARAAPLQGAPGRAGGAPRARCNPHAACPPRATGNTNRTRRPRKSPRNRPHADDPPSRGHRRRVRAARGAASARPNTNRTRGPRKSWRNRTRIGRGWREVPSARTSRSA